jgi:hypothetical protein
MPKFAVEKRTEHVHRTVVTVEAPDAESAKAQVDAGKYQPVDVTRNESYTTTSVDTIRD